METNDNKLQVRETSRIVGKVRFFSADQNAPSLEIIEAFEKLTDWQTELGRCLQSARSQRDLPAYTLPELLTRILDWTGPLWAVPEWGLRHCFNQAMAFRGQSSFGFEASEISRVWRDLSGSTRDALFKSFSANHSIAGPPCDWCNATGFVYVTKAGQRLKWNERQQGEAMKRCSHTDVGDQLPLEETT